MSFSLLCQKVKTFVALKMFIIWSMFPLGQLGKLWRAAVLEDTSFSNGSSIAELEFCCEDHFDVSLVSTIRELLKDYTGHFLSVEQITKDFYRKISTGTYMEYIVNAGVVPSLNLSDTKVGILDDVSLM